jgi:hypothetical protein
MRAPNTTNAGGSRLQDKLLAIFLEIIPVSLIMAEATHCWNRRLGRERRQNRWTGFEGEASSPAIGLPVQGSQFTASAFTCVLTVVIEIIARVERQPQGE